MIASCPVLIASSSAPAATNAGRPSVRERIAVCEVGPPCAVARPSTRPMSRLAVSDGDRSAASRMHGCTGRSARPPPAADGSSCASTRRPTSRRSAARPASTGLPSAARPEAICSMAWCQDHATPWPSTISWQVRVIRSVSSSSAACALKIAASEAPSRRWVSSCSAINCWRVRLSASCRRAPPSPSGVGRSATSACVLASTCTGPIASPGLAPMPMIAACASGGFQPATGVALRCAARSASAFSWATSPSMTLRSAANRAGASAPSADTLTASPWRNPSCSSATRLLASAA
ncbi:hypothetical protein D3C72_1041230 [compost metagenome]